MGSLAVITWLSCALPSVAGFAGRCSLCMLCRVWNYCQCIWKCHHKYTVTFAEGFLRHSAVLLILHCALSILPYSKLSVDAKIHPDVCLLVMQISNLDFSEHKCRIRVIPRRLGMPVGIWVAECSSTDWTPRWGRVILDSFGESECLLVSGAAPTFVS